ncbi:hypothetical protein MBM_00402 [Drepanopeziza brunnea f. sp. 'multigermtubi' MB_m1]|uniref:Uncharacterized protein n=1 Tax=Marssonina brunnea f. sp. multigermtubi (strain MB_m1) TaxID=1072389 RepID=K1Y830_MARBU|nr:uncharacterized protein MBM_00402 [Drepanopeziza brunnea f. sp. 'multigermtubi' MB_m1]EKD21289.1 hypothetical protein MBM_00402 [Drepanopeziza brunnea f. sp. 'multigermtubi' MB_m1]
MVSHEFDFLYLVVMEFCHSTCLNQRPKEISYTQHIIMRSTFVLILAASSFASALLHVPLRQAMGGGLDLLPGVGTGLASVPGATVLVYGATSSLTSVLSPLGGLLPVAHSASKSRRQLDSLGGLLGPLTIILGGLTGTVSGTGSGNLLPGASIPPASGTPAATEPVKSTNPIDMASQL